MHTLHEGKSLILISFALSILQKGVLNVMEGCDGEIKIEPNMTEDDIEKIF